MKYVLTFEADTLEALREQLMDEVHSFMPAPAPTLPVVTQVAPPEYADQVLNLSVRTMNCLKAEGIFLLSTLLRWNEDELLRIPNFGRKTLRELKEELALKKLSLSSHTAYRKSPVRDAV